jgi:hypothetical protein
VPAAVLAPTFARKFRFNYSKSVRVAGLNSESRALGDAGQGKRKVRHAIVFFEKSTWTYTRSLHVSNVISPGCQPLLNRMLDTHVTLPDCKLILGASVQ